VPGGGAKMVQGGRKKFQGVSCSLLPAPMELH